MGWRTKRPQAKGQLRPRGTMNKTETAYAGHLRMLEMAGEIAWSAYESTKLRLANNTWYTVDFTVMRADGQIEIHEVKGRKGETYYAEEDAKIKIKVAASLYPYLFVIVWPALGAGWKSEQVSADLSP